MSEIPPIWTSPMTGQKSFDQNGGASLIYNERGRQVREEGYDGTHDFGHEVELTEAALSYLMFAAVTQVQGYTVEEAKEAATYAGTKPESWPWAAGYWKPTGDPVRDLTKAGALIAAAIDAIQDRRVRESTEAERTS